MAGIVYALLVVTVAVVSVEAGWCWNTTDNWYTTWCSHGCCGDKQSECCSADDDDDKLTGGDIAGIVVGSLICLALVIGGVILVVYFFTTCFRQQTRRGVVYSNGATNPSVAATNINMTTYPVQQPTVTQTMYQYPQQQPVPTVVYNAGYM